MTPKLEDDPELAGRITARVKAGLSPEVAAKAEGVGRSTYYRWMAAGRAATEGRYRDFRDGIKRADAEAESTAVQVVRAAAPTTWQAAAWWLERRHPERWATDRNKKKAEIDLARAKAREAATLEELIRKASTEELRAVLERLRRERDGGG